MADNIGWIKLHRQIREHWIWEDANKLKWWFDIVLTVNNAPAKVNIGYEIFECNRGESLLSIGSWAERWKVSKDTARNFLTLLEKDNMISRVSLGKTTRLTVCNFDTYNECLHVNSSMPVRDANTNKNDKNDKNRVNKLTLSVAELSFIDLVNKNTGRKPNQYFKTLDTKTRKNFADLRNQGYEGKDFKKAIITAYKQMSERGRENYLTPEFIARPTEFQKYALMPERTKIEVETPSSQPQLIDHRTRS